MTLDQLIMVLLVVMVLIINFAMPIIRRAVLQREAERSEERAPVVPARRRAFPIEPPGRRFSSVSRGASPTGPPGGHRRNRPLLTLRAARRGVVLMTILGPCRANDPSVPSPPG